MTTATATTWSKENDAPLPWSDLRQRLDAATLAWLLEDKDREQQEQQVEEQEDETGARDLFATSSSGARATGENDNDDDADDEEYYPRVHQWSSSLTEPGGVPTPDRSTTTTSTSDQTTIHNNTIVQVQYILSDAPGGHGDTLWPAARHIANLLADPVQCRRLFRIPADEPAPQQHPNQQHCHPLQGKRFLELGAGAGLPSWTALHCGAAQVICTDQPIAARLGALAEAAERNVRQIQTTNAPTTTRTLVLQPHHHHHHQQVKVCAYSWGTPAEDVLRALPPMAKREEEEDDDDLRRFDVVVAADCIYMPDCHDILLQSIQQLLRPRQGVALLPFALHGNVPDPHVWSLVETARNDGFVVDILESQQLTTYNAITLDAKRALIHTLRLTLP